MAKVAIRATGLSKQYRIGEKQTAKTFREAVTEAVLAPFRRGRRAPRETIWALKDVSFEIAPGEVVGVIGRNGAGKSTLLKILSRITDPTEGRAEVHGRVGSLLEVGTGFHNELTGRENIFLNGAILGMKRAEIASKFDEIVAFAEVEKFLDTAVKHYSSGMYLRLAFAVAAHLEPDILLVDEVLAVGDAEFQKKCLGKMGDVASSGRTVLFVSHNMAAVQQLCRRGFVLDQGSVTCAGNIEAAVASYLQRTREALDVSLAERTDRIASTWLRLTRVVVVDRNGSEIRQALSGRDVALRFYYDSARVVQDATVNIAFNVRNAHGLLLTNLDSRSSGNLRMNVHRRGYFECRWPRFNLRSGSYDCAFYCEVNGEVVDWMQSAFTLSVEDGDFFGTGQLIARDQGDVLITHTWSSHEALG
ncbi:MAG: ABC transporter ATP-binding protein [Thermoanaerobaculales bacterium]